jgi:hypothetical protein
MTMPTATPIKPTATLAMTLKAASLLSLLALTACAGSQRFVGGPGPGPAYGQPTLQPAPPISSAPVTSEPLPPPGGYPPSGGYPQAGGSYPVASAQPGALPPPQDPYYTPAAPGIPQQTPPPAAPQPAEVPTLRGGSGEVATLGGAATTRPAVTSRDGVIGNWTAKEATGSSCRVQLSSAPALDLYRANAAGCANRDLQKVTAWDYRDGEVYLYQQGGTVVARLRTSGGGAMDGAITKSGAGLSLNR